MSAKNRYWFPRILACVLAAYVAYASYMSLRLIQITLEPPPENPVPVITGNGVPFASDREHGLYLRELDRDRWYSWTKVFDSVGLFCLLSGALGLIGGICGDAFETVRKRDRENSAQSTWRGILVAPVVVGVLVLAADSMIDTDWRPVLKAIAMYSILSGMFSELAYSGLKTAAKRLFNT